MLPAVESARSDVRFDSDLHDFICKYVQMWGDCDAELPVSNEIFSSAMQQHNENEADLQIEFMEKELRKYPHRWSEQEAWRERIFKRLRQLGTNSFRFPDRHFDIIFSPEYLTATREFVHQARTFNEAIEAASLGQALRNVWVMNCLQMFLDQRPSLSPAIFAYSMLYPYTDNYLDDPRLSSDAKEAASHRLRLRLSAEILEPCNPDEAAVFTLVEKIESQYPRIDFPEVYSSLLAIHAGQAGSLRQQSGICTLDAESLLKISVEKGGTSVLADGWLVAGCLSPTEADFFFGLGVMLQLLDDIQDFLDDRVAGHWTLFTQTATRDSLDALTSRLWQFLNRILDSGGCFRDAHSLELRDLIRRNSRMLLLGAMSENANYYSCDYLRQMERYSPLRFSYLRDHRQTVERSFAKIWPQVARQHKLGSVFDLLG